MLNLSPVCCSGLPLQAWCTIINRLEKVVKVYHGSSVEIIDNCVVEGAWNSSFDPNGFREASVLCGSGLEVNESVIIRGPSHSLERIWLLRLPKSVLVSNSLPLLLAVGDKKIILPRLHLEADLLSFIDGINGIRKRVKLGKGLVIEQFIAPQLQVSSELDVRVIGTTLLGPQSFVDYSDYIKQVQYLCEQLCKNANAPERTSRYQPLASISRGYDSPACAIFASLCGATKAITFAKAREGYDTSSDDGSDIAQTIGLEAIKLNRTDYMNQTDDHYFLASGGGGEDAVFAAAKKILKQSIFFTGYKGDTLWGMKAIPKFSHYLRTTYPGGGSLGEFRLNTDFIHLPLPMIYLQSHESVHKISCSNEMAPWRIGNEYDRPIPRRLVESKGVNRTAFGQAKMAVTVPMYYGKDLHSMLSHTCVNSFEHFLVNSSQSFQAVLWMYSTGYFARLPWKFVKERLSWRTRKLNPTNPIRIFLEQRLSHRWRRRPSADLLLPHWAIETLRFEYRQHLKQSCPL